MIFAHCAPRQSPDCAALGHCGGSSASAAGFRRMGRAALCLLACWVSSLPASPAAAQSLEPTPVSACPEPTASDTQAAKTAFRDGQHAFTEGAYSSAVDLWSDAYRLDCNAHPLLLNLAMAQELLGRPEDAARTLELFNRRASDSPYVEPNRKRIERLHRAWTEQSRARAREQHKRALPPPSPPPPPDALDTNIVALAVAAGGALAALTGGALYLQAHSAAASAAERCGASRAHCTSVDDVVAGERARARAEVAGWLTGAGLATAAVGTLWYVFSLPEPPAGVEWGASLSSTQTSFHVSGTY